jgi:2-polyprenyl-3-methyl-5-hydroxy-6-metoxy-1,4-benzoquinol methylase
MKRIAEPELMDSEAQTLAYAQADFEEANTLFADNFLDRFAGLGPTGQMADLGCGPGDIAIRLAMALPGWQVTGIDAGENMLRRARERLESESLGERVNFRLAYLPDPSLPKKTWDAVISNSLLHHLPDPLVLWESISGLGVDGAAVQVMDLVRPDSATAARDLVNRYADGAPEILREDFYNSLLAAYTISEIQEQLAQAKLEQLRVEPASDRHWIVSGTL